MVSSAYSSSSIDARAKKRILVVDDDLHVRLAIETVLRKRGYSYSSAQSAAEARDLITNPKNKYDMVITDWKMESKDAGLEVVQAAVARNVDTPVLVVTGFANVNSAVQAMKYGAYDFIEKPFDIDELEAIIATALRRKRSSRVKHKPELLDKGGPFDNLIGSSPAVGRIRKTIEAISDTSVSTLLTGETGTGKEVFARAIHRASARREGLFVPVNCGAIPEGLFESEMFGYVKGAFTGTPGDKKGLFEEAHKGTIFLDEIGELPLASQVKLLRTIQDKTVRRLGDSRDRKIDIRILAATNRDLEKEVAEGRFREDLYYRLNVIHIEIPPLRERKEDLQALIQHFIQRFNVSDKRNVEGMTPTANQALLGYRWPGNVRELENTIERMVILKRTGFLDWDDLPAKIRRAIGEPPTAPVPPPPPSRSTRRPAQPVAAPPRMVPAPDPNAPQLVDMSRPMRFKMPQEGIDLKSFIEELEFDLIDQALALKGGTVKQAAELLQMKRTTLVERLKKRDRKRAREAAAEQD